MHWRISDQAAAGITELGQIDLLPANPLRFPQLRANQATDVVWEALAVTPANGHSLSVEEAYQREGDLVVRYGQAEDDEYGFQLNWRLLPVEAPFALAVELWLSIQTNLLDAQPELGVTCRALSGEQWQPLALTTETKQATEASPARSTCPAAMLCQGQLGSALWIIEPSDQTQANLKHSEDPRECQLGLFGHFMEKGVIRRARMRLFIACEPIEDPHWQAASREFSESPLPLTA